MGLSSCPACGANVNVATDIATGDVVVLEFYTDSSPDAPRYRIVSHGSPMTVERVPDNAPGDFYPDHKWDCPDFGGGHAR